MLLRLQEEMEVALGDAARPRLQRLPRECAEADAGGGGPHLGLEDGKRRFADCVLRMTQAFALCCTLPAAVEYREEIAFLQAVRTILTKSDPTKALE